MVYKWNNGGGIRTQSLKLQVIVRCLTEVISLKLMSLLHFTYFTLLSAQLIYKMPKHGIKKHPTEVIKENVNLESFGKVH